MQSDIGQMLLLVGRWCRSSHSNEGDSWFIKKRNDSAYDEVSIDKKYVYVAKKAWRQNKENPRLSVCIA